MPAAGPLPLVASCAPPCPRSGPESHDASLSGPQLSIMDASEDTPLLARQKPRSSTNRIRNSGCLSCQHTLPLAPTTSTPQVHVHAAVRTITHLADLEDQDPCASIWSSPLVVLLKGEHQSDPRRLPPAHPFFVLHQRTRAPTITQIHNLTRLPPTLHILHIHHGAHTTACPHKVAVLPRQHVLPIGEVFA